MPPPRMDEPKKKPWTGELRCLRHPVSRFGEEKYSFLQFLPILSLGLSGTRLSRPPRTSLTIKQSSSNQSDREMLTRGIIASQERDRENIIDDQSLLRRKSATSLFESFSSIEVHWPFARIELKLCNITLIYLHRRDFHWESRTTLLATVYLSWPISSTPVLLTNILRLCQEINCKVLQVPNSFDIFVMLVSTSTSKWRLFLPKLTTDHRVLNLTFVRRFDAGGETVIYSMSPRPFCEMNTNTSKWSLFDVGMSRNRSTQWSRYLTPHMPPEGGNILPDFYMKACA